MVGRQFSSGYSVSLFSCWENHRIAQVWVKHRFTSVPAVSANTGILPAFYGATPAAEDMHPIGGCSAENCTRQLGIPGPWHDRLPHFRMDFTPSNGAELQTEYFVPRDRAYDAIRAVQSLSERIAPLLLVTELRAVAADDLWMSMAYQLDSLAIHFTWKPMQPEVAALLPSIEEKLAPFAARPHWGKLFTTSPSRFAALYPRLADFRALAQRYDPPASSATNF